MFEKRKESAQSKRSHAVALEQQHTKHKKSKQHSIFRGGKTNAHRIIIILI